MNQRDLERLRHTDLRVAYLDQLHFLPLRLLRIQQSSFSKRRERHPSTYLLALTSISNTPGYGSDVSQQASCESLVTASTRPAHETTALYIKVLHRAGPASRSCSTSASIRRTHPVHAGAKASARICLSAVRKLKSRAKPEVDEW